MRITIKEYDPEKKKDILHISVKIDGDKEHETILPKDVFEILYTSYRTVLDQVRMLAAATKELTDAVEKQDKEMIKQIMIQQIMQFTTQKFETGNKAGNIQQRKKAIIDGRERMIRFYTQTGNYLADKFEPRGIDQKTAMVLVVSQTPFADVENAIREKKKFVIDVPISDYSNFDSLYKQQSTTWISIFDSALSVAKNLNFFG